MGLSTFSIWSRCRLLWLPCPNFSYYSTKFHSSRRGPDLRLPIPFKSTHIEITLKSNNSSPISNTIQHSIIYLAIATRSSHSGFSSSLPNLTHLQIFMYFIFPNILSLRSLRDTPENFHIIHFELLHWIIQINPALASKNYSQSWNDRD